MREENGDLDRDGTAGTGMEVRTLLVVCSALFFSVLNGTMVNVALPVIGEELSVETARLGWIVTGYLLVFGVAVPFYGRLADIYGARRLFVLGMCIFTAGSVLCALSQGYLMLFGARIVQACGAAAIPGLGMALISRAYPPERRGAALGYVSATIGVGAAIGPSLGGVVTDALSWHFLFGFSACAGLLVPVALRVLRPSERDAHEGFDLLGGILLALAVGGALLAATESSRGNPGSPVVLGALGVGILALAGLVIRQRSYPYPFLPRDLIRNRRYLALAGISFSAMVVSLSTTIALPLLLAQTERLSPREAGLTLLPGALALALLGPVAGRLADRVGGRLPIRIGLLVMLLGGLALSAYTGASVWTVTALNAVIGAGFAFVNSPLSAMVSLVVPADRLAAGLSINSMSFFLGGSFGTALLSAVLTARERSAQAFNPLHAGRAVGFSDALLVLLAPLLVALALSLLLPAVARRAVKHVPEAAAEVAVSGAPK